MVGKEFSALLYYFIVSPLTCFKLANSSLGDFLNDTLCLDDVLVVYSLDPYHLIPHNTFSWMVGSSPELGIIVPCSSPSSTISYFPIHDHSYPSPYVPRSTPFILERFIYPHFVNLFMILMRHKGIF